MDALTPTSPQCARHQAMQVTLWRGRWSFAVFWPREFGPEQSQPGSHWAAVLMQHGSDTQTENASVNKCVDLVSSGALRNKAWGEGKPFANCKSQLAVAKVPAKSEVN